MIKRYNFNYNSYDADVSFIVDTEIFTNEHAQATLDFFLWDYDSDADPIDEVMKKYAIEAIKIATYYVCGVYGVKEQFKELEGYCLVDGSSGIELVDISGYEFEEDDLVVDIIDE